MKGSSVQVRFSAYKKWRICAVCGKEEAPGKGCFFFLYDFMRIAKSFLVINSKFVFQCVFGQIQLIF